MGEISKAFKIKHELDRDMVDSDCCLIAFWERYSVAKTKVVNM